MPLDSIDFSGYFERMRILAIASIVLLLIHSAAAKPLPWKYDFEVISGPRYVVNNDMIYCDKNDHIYMTLLLNFAENTDAYHARSTTIVIVSKDKGVSWQISKRPWPGTLNNRSVLKDGTIVETGTHYWLRHPRTEIARLRKQGFYVWDLGEQRNYCAILHDMWVRQSSDNGKTWRAFPVHQQFGFFSRLAVNSPPRQSLLADGTIVNFVHGYRAKSLNKASDLGGTNAPYIIRSSDQGKTWQMIRMADGKKSPSPRGFNEIYPVVNANGKIFAMLRTAVGTQSYSVSSSDGGRTWTPARPTPILAKHPNPTVLRDGSIVCSYQRRYAKPFGVRARLTPDGGKSWNKEITLRDDLTIADGLVQPITVELSDGSLVTVFTGTKRLPTGGKRSFIGGSRWTRDQKAIAGIEVLRRKIKRRGIWTPKVALPPLKPRYNGGKVNQSPWK